MVLATYHALFVLATVQYWLSKKAGRQSHSQAGVIEVIDC
jgi:hypothetical protein